MDISIAVYSWVGDGKVKYVVVSSNDCRKVSDETNSRQIMLHSINSIGFRDTVLDLMSSGI